VSLPNEPKKPRCRALDSGYDRQGKSRKQETRIAKILGGRRQPRSGGSTTVGKKGESVYGAPVGRRIRGNSYDSMLAPGDVSHASLLLEAKRTDANSIRVEGDWLVKIEAEAQMLGKIPALAVEIAGMSTIAEKDWILLPASVVWKIFKLGGKQE